jgi:hypothetical protein
VRTAERERSDLKIRMTEDELNELGQFIQRFVAAGTGWILVMIPPHEMASHPAGCCPVQTTGNLGSEERMHDVLAGAAEMFELGTHAPMFMRPVEKLQ